MKRTLISAALAAAAVLAVPATAQMMGGYGPGYGMGPGMMGGYGGGYGPGYGMGPGMMWGYGGGYGYGNLNLTSEQRAKIAEIQEGFRKKQWALMQSMHEVRWGQADAYREGKLDENAVRKSFDAMTELRKQMFENSLAARKGIDAVLTPEQRKQLGEGR
jgi:Spy/CpxP family protein refolding chaperone